MPPSPKTSKVLSPTYRPDIDGLRAVAVLPVVLNHAGLGCPGGFVGVDVFFVISGYVICSLMLREIEAGSFSLLRFWERRVRRIMPALSLMVAAVLTAGWLFYLPKDFVYMAKSVVAQTLMAANIFYWRGSIEYFEMSFGALALLHTWSLAVEEQFYLFFPLLLIFLVRVRPSSWRHWFLGIAAVSLVVSTQSSCSDSNARAAFYLLPSRAWELLAGALLAMYRDRLPASARLREASGVLGGTLIAWSVMAYSEQSSFPGLAALPPCLGAALIIASSEAGVSHVGRLLSWSPLVFVGLVSYPLYLWHWPLLTFARYLNTNTTPLGAPMRLGLLLAGLVLAMLSWKYVETPFRQRRWLEDRHGIFILAGICCALFLATAGVVIAFKGFPARFPDRVLAFSDARVIWAFPDQVGLVRARSGQFMELGSASRSQPIRMLLWGDSHAKAVAPPLDMLCREHGLRGVLSAYGATPPVLDFVPPSLKSLHKTAPEVADCVVAFVAAQRIENVILAARWNIYPPSVEFKNALVRTVRTLLKTGAKVYLLKDVPTPGFDVPRVAAFRALHGGDLESFGITQAQHRKSEALLQPTFDELARMGATVLDPTAFFLNGQGICRVIKDGKILYFDSNHLTMEGADLLLPLFRPLFQAH